MVMRGILYGVGVGPGDPELMTLKAVRLIKENDIIAVPGAEVRETVAYKIAVQAVPELADKELLPIYMPMTHDKAELELNHEKGAKALEAALDTGKNVVFLTLGVAGKLIKYSDNGSTLSAVNFPEVSLPLHGGRRLMHIHENRPGVLTALNKIFAI